MQDLPKNSNSPKAQPFKHPNPDTLYPVPQSCEPRNPRPTNPQNPKPTNPNSQTPKPLLKHQIAEGIFNILNSNLLNKSYANNLIGFATNGAFTLRGKNHSVLTRLKEMYPNNLWDFYDICHVLLMYWAMSNYVSSAIPTKIERLLKDNYNFFSHSAKRLQNSI